MNTGIKLDSITHDLLVDNNGFVLLKTDEEATVQLIKMRLLTYKGEWFRDIEIGLPYTQQMLGKNTKDAADANIKRTILTTDNVKSLVSYESLVTEDRVLQVLFSIKVGSGEIINDVLVRI